MKNLILIFFLLPLTINAQNQAFKDFCKEYDMETANVLNKKGQELAVEFAKVTLKLRAKHQELENTIKSEIQKSNPNFNAIQLEQEYIKQLTLNLFAYSENIIVFDRRYSDDCPEETKTLILICNDIDELLRSNSNLSLSEQFKLASANYLTFMKKHTEQLNKDYAEGYYDPELINNLGNYLRHKSDLFCRAFMFATSVNSWN